MAVKLIIDELTKKIKVKPGVTSLDVKVDVYSDLKEDWQDNENLRKFKFPIIPIGGNVIGSGQVAPTYYFLRYPWIMETSGDGSVLPVALNLYGLAQNGVDARNPWVIVPGDGLDAEKSSLPGLDTQMNEAIQYSSFGGVVTVDENSTYFGTVFPVGTPRQPVNNIPDAVLIAQTRGFDTLFINGNYTFDAGDNIEGYTIIGNTPERSVLTFNSNALTQNINVYSAEVTGVFDNAANFKDCHIIDTDFVKGSINNCVLRGEIGLAGGLTILIDCKDGIVEDSPPPSINFKGSGSSLAIRNYAGDITLKNKTGTESVEINMATGGHVSLDNTITDGNIRITGIAQITDNTTGTTIVDTSNVIFPEQLQLAAFNGYVYINVNGGSVGTKFPQGTLQYPVNNLADAFIIGANRGIENYLLSGTLVVTNLDISNKVFVGENNLDAVLVLSGGNNINTRTTFRNLIIVGRVNGYFNAESCALQTISNLGSDVFPTIFRDCIIRADSGAIPAIQCSNIINGHNIHFINCVSGVPGESSVTLDINNGEHPIAFRNFSGGVAVKNQTANTQSTYALNSGKIVLDSASVTAGNIVVRGEGKLVDDVNNTIPTGVWNLGATIINETSAYLTSLISGGSSPWTTIEKDKLISDTAIIKDQSEISALHAIEQLNE